ncbi:MAG: thermonuclease family protein [Rhodospirillaceae bacterium]|nr:thermonuclease family protein [Rhodospirillaceae bacterium]MDE0617679.1 thermonuclease family protein [Rhodospirillaceae bacterium]
MTYVKRKPFFRLILRAAPAVGAIALTAVLCTTPARGEDYLWPVTRVIDGDTVEVKVPGLPPELAHIRVRLRSADTPGIGRYAKCPSEKRIGQAARDFTEMQITKAERILVRNPEWEGGRGRVKADLILNGKTLSALLIEAGHGRPYRRGQRQNWCPDSED